ncbi:coagulation factor IX isoform X2 [Boleophthalmus pectinirostris]|uniref:coagulation factor IX isoform X2 n=1 Tax=Boleophthalmus pectinirostris TaxID=150288 RepID=UPI000A1C3AA5|nr:coagulation factor IX isoform X2 [Boleophthalmus pectinirostris]
MRLNQTLCLLLCSQLIHCNVFVERVGALQLLSSAPRRRRANARLLEEVLPGDLERECYEETCSQEEAYEIFQTREKTLEFWYRYKSVSRCRLSLCLNGGLCTLDQGHVQCLCPPQYHGPLCETERRKCSFKNGGCVQYCSDLPGGAGVKCGCAEGYKLNQDGLTCSPTVEFPCGRQQNQGWIRTRSLLLPDHNQDQNWTQDEDWNRTETWNRTWTLEPVNPSWAEPEGNVTSDLRSGRGQGEARIVGGALEVLGGSPWTVLIRREDGFGFCGGTLVSERWVLTAAHCFQETKAHHITAGDVDKMRPDPGEQKVLVQKVLVHPHFHDFTLDSDVALILLKTPVLFSSSSLSACLPDPHLSTYLLRDVQGVVSGWGTTQFLGRSSRFLRKVTLPVVSYETCSGSTEQVITDNMFCAGVADASRDSCSGDSGGPFVVHFRGTWFVTGVVSWGEQCAARGKYGVYARVGHFLGWIRETMATEERREEEEEEERRRRDRALNQTQTQDQNQDPVHKSQSLNQTRHNETVNP